MKVGIVIAILRELKAFLDANYSFEILNVNNKDIYHFKVNDNDVYAIHSGFGKIDAAASSQILISKFDCDLLLNFGVTGALDKSLKVKDLFIVTKTLNYDYDVSTIDPVKLHQYEEFKDEFIPLDNNYIKLAKKIDPSILDAICASGDRFITDKKFKEQLFNDFNTNICDMEVAAIARVCFLNKIPLLSIKCISDTFDGDGKDFNLNVTNSAAKAFNFIIKLLNHLK